MKCEYCEGNGYTLMTAVLPPTYVPMTLKQKCYHCYGTGISHAPKPSLLRRLFGWW